MTFAQRMVTSKEPTGENEIPGMAPAQKIIIVLALIAFVVFMGYTITDQHGPALTDLHRASMPARSALVQPSTSAPHIRKVAPWL